MSIITRISAVLLTSATLGACAAVPQTNHYDASPAQRVMPSNSMLGEACDGHDSSGSLRLSGHTYLTADFNVDAVVFGSQIPYGKISSPVTKGTSQMASPLFSGQPGPENCTGLAVRTTVRREGLNVFMDWVMEITPKSGSDVRPSDPYRVVGRTAVPDNGYATDTVAFELDGKPMLVHLHLMPGTVWVAEQNEWHIKQMDVENPMPGMAASPLPDELPGRTLYDVTNPAFR